MIFGVVFEGAVLGQSEPSKVEELIDALADELYELDTTDLSVAATLSTGTFEVSLTVDAEDVEAAIVQAAATLRTAIHAIGGATPGWEVVAAKARQVEPVPEVDTVAACTASA
jgi:hypothetical protein